jgi:hypothetical protein
MINMKNNNLIEKEDKLVRRIVLKAKTIRLKNNVKVACEVNSNDAKTIGKAVLAELLTIKLVKTGLDLVIDNELITSLLALGAGFMAAETVINAEEKQLESKDELKLRRIAKKYTNKNIEEMKNIKEIKELAELLNMSEEAVFNLMIKRD